MNMSILQIYGNRRFVSIKTYSYRIGEKTVSEIVEEVSGALWNRLQPLVLKECITSDWRNNANDFKEICQFDYCIGAIDGKHVVVSLRIQRVFGMLHRIRFVLGGKTPSVKKR